MAGGKAGISKANARRMLKSQRKRTVLSKTHGPRPKRKGHRRATALAPGWSHVDPEHRCPDEHRKARDTGTVLKLLTG